VRIAVTKSFLGAPVWLASDQGFFHQAGLEVVLSEFDAGPATLAAMLCGEADLATVVDVSIVLQLFERQDFAIMTTLATSDTNIRIITRTDTGIEHATGLRGKIIGTVMGTSAHFMLYAALLQAGLTLADVKILEARPIDLPELLRARAVDAVAIWEPYASRVEEALQGEAVRLPNSGLYRYSLNLVVRSAFAEQYPVALRQVVQALDATITFMHEHNAHAYQRVGEWFRTDTVLTERSWEEYTFALTLDQAMLITLESIARWAIRNRLTVGTRVPNMLHHVYFDALAHGKPDAITIIR
jgi:NitT/TauT family transport system substrate-binding protein